MTTNLIALNRTLRVSFLLFFSTIFICRTASAQLNMIETDSVRVVTYDFGHKYILPYAVKSFTNSLRFHKKLFDYEPSQKITILIQDFGDFGNGGATAVPTNAISMGLSPFSYTFETSPAGERIFSMMNHELVHVIALDNATNTDRFYQKLFLGKVIPTNEHPVSTFYSFLTSPRRYSPRWYHEGIAAYIETWMSGGVGLAMGSYDEMVFRTRVYENAHIYSAQGLESEGTTTDFQGKSNSYLYGTRFMGYLSYTYGPESIINWTKRREGSKRFYSGQFKNVYGKPLTDVWDDWLVFERDWQTKNIKKLQQSSITETRPVTEKTLGSVSFPHYDKKRNKVYAAINYPGKIPHLASIDVETGTIKRLTDIKGAALFYVSSVIYDEINEIIYFTTDNDAWRDLNSYDVETGKTKLLQRDFRTGDLAFNKSDQSIWGIKHLNGYSTIVKVPKKSEDQEDPTATYAGWSQKYTLPYGKDIFDIDVSPDGTKLSAAVTDLVGNQSLMLFDVAALEDGRAEVDTIFNFKITSPQSFVFSDDGKYLYGCSYYSGVSNIFRVDLATGDIFPMSNTLTGLFRPIPINEDDLFVFEFTSAGFRPALIDNKTIPGEEISTIEFLGNVTIEKHPQLKDWELSMKAAQEIEFSDEELQEEKYKPGKLFGWNSAYPVVIGYKDFIGIGYHLSLSDPLSFNNLDMTLGYTPRSWSNGIYEQGDTTTTNLEDDELFHFNFTARKGAWTISGSYNDASFYDIFGPTRFSRRGTDLRVDYNRSLVWDRPKVLDLNVGVGGFYGLERSPDFQQITGFDSNLFLNMNTSLSYRNMKASLGAVDYEKGFKTSLTAATAASEGNFFPSLIGSFDFGFPLPGNHFSLWFRSAAGHSFSDAFNPFSRFGFAAFGNNYIDFQTSRRYRRAFSFPGVSFDSNQAIIAQDFGKSMAELVFPPIRFKKLGGLNFYSNWMQFTAFSSYLNTTDISTFSNRFYNFGTQMDMKLVIFSVLESTFSIGYAKAFDVDSSNSFEEWMLSLKLLR